jgi:hypothetical protein
VFRPSLHEIVAAVVVAFSSVVFTAIAAVLAAGTLKDLIFLPKIRSFNPISENSTKAKSYIVLYGYRTWHPPVITSKKINCFVSKGNNALISGGFYKRNGIKLVDS